MKRIFLMGWLLGLLAVPAHAKQVVIVIDDIGYNLQTGLAVARLPFPVTLAIIPFSPYAKYIAQVAKDNGKDVIVHSPMASLDGSMIDPGGLHPEMSEHEFIAALQRQLAAVPHALGLNNHMGSLLTQQPQAMAWLMETLKREQLYFIDSRTTAETVALQTAVAHGVTSWQRDVFLDHYREAQVIQEQLASVLPLAKANGLVVAIGHPYSETIAALADNWQQMEAAGVEFVVPSTLTADKLLARDSTVMDAIFD